MHNTQKIADDLIYVGASDRKLSLFENIYPVPQGVSYNSYLLIDDKTVLFDAADAAVNDLFLANVEAALGGRKLDYVVVHHVEPDHAALLPVLLNLYPESRVLASAKAAQMVGQFFGQQLAQRITPVKEGDTLDTGHHSLVFTMAPMVHWPEVMMTFDATTGTLFSADAFGTFGALNGNLFADQFDFQHEQLAEARRYLVNIVGKYGVQVQNVLKKAATLDIKMICPLHGPVWRNDIDWLIDKYNHWSTYEPEDRGVVVIYGSIYGHTELAACRMASLLADRGVKGIKVYDASHTDVSTLLAECFRVSHIVLAAPTYNNGLFTPVENLLADLKAHGLQRRKWALIENGSWAPQSGKLMRAAIEEMKDMTVVGDMLTLKSAMSDTQDAALAALADAVVASLAE
ncbi:MAG: FprA family A-type flavoprotein [Bacteroidales bacterium]|nr:FprA family A-type flavoprotein [Bacteroidales bacterium]